MRIPALLGVVSANALNPVGQPRGLGRSPERDNHDLVSLLSQAADDPSVEDNGLLLIAVRAIADGVTGGRNRSEELSVEGAWTRAQIAVDGKSNLIDIVVSLTLAIPGDILNLLNGYLDFQLNSINKKNAPLTERRIYPFEPDGQGQHTGALLWPTPRLTRNMLHMQSITSLRCPTLTLLSFRGLKVA